MAIPFSTNTFCDVYRTGNTPPATPDAAGIRCRLRADFAERNEVGEAGSVRYTHVMTVARGIDVRDDFASIMPGTNDTVYIPNKNGTPFRVRFVTRANRGMPSDHKKVYLDRQTPNWPTNEL